MSYKCLTISNNHWMMYWGGSKDDYKDFFYLFFVMHFIYKFLLNWHFWSTARQLA